MSYDPEMLGMLIHVFDEAWVGIQAMLEERPLIPLAGAHNLPSASWPLPLRASAIRAV